LLDVYSDAGEVIHQLSASALAYFNKGFTIVAACNNTLGEAMGAEPVVERWRENVDALAQVGGYIGAQAENSFSFADTVKIFDAIHYSTEIVKDLKQIVIESAALCRLQIQIADHAVVGPWPIFKDENLTWFAARGLAPEDPEQLQELSLDDYYALGIDSGEDFNRLITLDWPNFGADAMATWLKQTYDVTVATPLTGASFRLLIKYVLETPDLIKSLPAELASVVEAFEDPERPFADVAKQLLPGGVFFEHGCDKKRHCWYRCR